MLGLDDQSKPVTGFWEPLITVAFLSDDNVFISCYHRFRRENYHFIYSYVERRPLSDVTVTVIEKCTPLNFPIKSFYSQHSKDCYTFFRQGQCLTVDPLAPDTPKQEKITDADLGTMYLLFEQALVTRSSSSILFFKIDPETGLWKQYKAFENMRGQIYFIRGNVRIQVTTDEKIYFYIIDRETCEPRLENVMYNFMQCSQMMFGKRVRYGITYKNDQSGFQIFTRKYFHNFKVQIDSDDFEGAIGLNMKTIKRYIMARNQEICMHD